MKAVVIFRDTLRKYYADYDFIIRPLLKFLMALSFLTLFKNYIGYNETVLNPLVILGLSAVCMLFPYGCITLICTLFVLANMYSVSLAFFALGAILSVFVIFLYFGFRPGNALAIILIPVAFLLKIPYSIPVILGMTIGLGAVIPVSIGVVFWFLVDLFHRMAPELTVTRDISVILADFISISEALFTDQTMYLTLIAFILAIGVACILKKLSFDHVWTVTAVVSLLTVLCAMIAGSFLIESSLEISELLVFSLLSLPVVLVFVLLFFQVDYKATEYLQFEDDSYYYYVKAVPKITSDEEKKESDR